MKIQNYSKEETVEELDVDVIDKETSKLVVFNDDYNTFDHVINVLVKVCKHTFEQAEQCAWIVHFKGKCSVKEGSEVELLPLKRAILDEGIEAKIL